MANTVPKTSLRPFSREDADVLREDNEAWTDVLMRPTSEYRGLAKDPIALLGWDPNMIRTGPRADRAAYYWDHPTDLTKDDMLSIGADYMSQNATIGHEARHRGDRMLVEYANSDPEAFAEKYGSEALMLILSQQKELRNELFDEAPSTQPNNDMGLDYVPSEALEYYRRTGSWYGAPEFLAVGQDRQNELLQNSTLGLKRAALDLLDQQGRMPMDAGDPEINPRRAGPRREEEGFLQSLRSGIASLFGK